MKKETRIEIDEILKGLEAVLIDLTSNYDVKLKDFNIKPGIINDPLSTILSLIINIDCRSIIEK